MVNRVLELFLIITISIIIVKSSLIVRAPKELAKKMSNIKIF